jgi:hypothetical protein
VVEARVFGPRCLRFPHCHGRVSSRIVPVLLCYEPDFHHRPLFSNGRDLTQRMIPSPPPKFRGPHGLHLRGEQVEISHLTPNERAPATPQEHAQTNSCDESMPNFQQRSRRVLVCQLYRNTKAHPICPNATGRLRCDH